MNSIQYVLLEHIAINARKGKQLALRFNTFLPPVLSNLVDYFQQIEDIVERIQGEEIDGHR